MAVKKTQKKPGRLAQLTKTIEGWALASDKTEIWYRSNGKGIPIICCNGLGCSTVFFTYFEKYFKHQAQVVTWDYRGHGQSAEPYKPENHTLFWLTKDLKTVMDHLGIDKAILVGHSMGTQVIYDFYARYPKRVLALVPCFGTFEKPIDTFFDFPLSKYIFEVVYVFNHMFPKVANLLGTVLLKNPLWFQMAGLLKMLVPNLVDREVLEDYVDHITKVDPTFFAQLTKSMQEHTPADLRKIKTPTLILGAEEDTFTPVWLSKKMHHLIPDSELFIVKKGSHVALVEQPELINLRIEKFLRERVKIPRSKKTVRKKPRARKLKKIA